MEVENNVTANCTCEMEVYSEIKNLPADKFVVHIVDGLGKDMVSPFDVNFSKDDGEARFKKQREE